MPKSKTDRITSTLRNLARRDIDDDLVFGIDVGIASVGWAVVNTKAEKIKAIGSRCFEPPEELENNKYKSHKAHRGEKRRSRRGTERKRGRKKAILRLLEDAGLRVDTSKSAVAKANPWRARALAASQKVSDEDAAIALRHIAKYRGPKLSAKSDDHVDSKQKQEDKKVTEAINRMAKLLNGRTVGQYLWDEHREGRKHNRTDNYQFSWRREWLQSEAEQIIDKQFELGGKWANSEFKNRFLDAAFAQKPQKSSLDLVGNCPHEHSLKRAPRVAYSFEMFRLLQKLNHECRVRLPHGSSRRLEQSEFERICEQFGTNKTISLATLKRYMRLTKGHELYMLNPLTADVTGNKDGGAFGSNTLYKILKEGGYWDELIKTPWKLDEIAKIISLNQDDHQIQKRLKRLPISDEVVNRLLVALSDPSFSKFSGTGNISLRAARKLIPQLMLDSVKDYSDACKAVGYSHSESQYAKIEDIPSAVVQRAVHEALKQIAFLVSSYGRPQEIHIESMRDVGKSAEERRRYKLSQSSNHKRNEEERKHFEECVGREPTRNEQWRFRLWKQQNGSCAYCQEPLRPTHIANADTQIDHIWPRSNVGEMWGDGNKVLTHIGCNQNKGNQTPWEWKGQDPKWWDAFKARVRNFRVPKDKIERLLDDKGFDADRVKEFSERNKSDTRHSSRVIHSLTMQLYPESYKGGTITEGAKLHVFTNPGRVTARLRHEWLKGCYYKYRGDDRQHAMDALIVAMVTDKRLKQLTKAYQRMEKIGRDDEAYPILPKPWESFTKDAVDAYDGEGNYPKWLVSRPENQRARGALHREIIRSTPNKTSVRVNTRHMGQKNDRSRGGYADHASGGMVRADLFYVNDERNDPRGIKIAKGYHLVPVYLWDVESRKKKRDRKKSVINNSTPLKAIVAKKSVTEWPEMDPGDFVMSLYPGSYIDLRDTDGTLIYRERRDGTRIPLEGYYRSTNIFRDGINISPHNDHQGQSMIDNVNIKRKQPIVIRKFQVDRLGIKHKIPAGKEEWPGYQYDR